MVEQLPRDGRPVIFVGSAREDLRAFPADVRKVMGVALQTAELGGKHAIAKPLKGFHGASVLEIVDDHDGDTYRAVYTTKLKGVIFVLHAFQKKSKRGRETPPRDLNLIKARLKQAAEIYDERFKTQKAG
ncbi:MAG: type II toxin-antitoxin system RelE/ParE family toxin [Methyloceanibacter sp.]